MARHKTEDSQTFIKFFCWLPHGPAPAEGRPERLLRFQRQPSRQSTHALVQPNITGAVTRGTTLQCMIALKLSRWAEAVNAKGELERAYPHN
mmetsp:Transcript_47199/g.109157  ORF Transcript_47199/g.109157 Transcript_47199/m.109157 type:complete len:92 (-) Transcript_47199:608-883(-)